MNFNIENLQKKVTNNIDNQKDKYINISHSIFEHPEIGNEEFFASKLLEDTLENEGFSLEKAVAGHPTSFIARKKSSLKSGSTVCYLAEYDALPNLGHACGHNIIGTASIAAAISLSKLIDEIGGEIVVFGTPAEEGGENGSAKASFVKHNLLHGIDVCLMIHPGYATSVTSDSLAVDCLEFEYIGKAAHAASHPEQGINALDAIISLFNGINALRQQVTDDVRIHGIITDGGKAPNIIPDYARAKFFVRAAKRKNCDNITKKVINIAKGAELSTGAKLNFRFFQNKIDNFLITKTLDKIFVDSLKTLHIDISDIPKDYRDSTDAGNISQIIPTIQPHIKIGSDKLVAHTEEFAKAAISSEGDYALIIGGKALAFTGLTLLTDRDKLNKVKKDFEKSKIIENQNI